uniref:Uncharacterized protein n=1 Tax=Arundo donax TaxID=35708 RepID=A0A0A9CSG7_ARUDO
MPCAENVQAMRETKGARGGGGAEAEGHGRAEAERHDTGEKGSGGGTRWQGHNDGGRLRRHCNGGRIWEWIWHQRRGCSGRFESWMWPGHWRRGSFFHRWLPRPLPRALHQSDVSSNCASSSFGTGIMFYAHLTCKVRFTSRKDVKRYINEGKIPEDPECVINEECRTDCEDNVKMVTPVPP